MKKLLAMLLILALMLSLTPAAFADDLPEEEPDDPWDWAEYPTEEPESEEPGGDDPQDDEPGYGVWPEDEDPEPEEEPGSGEEEAFRSVLVRFCCEPAETAVVVYDGTPLIDGSWRTIGAAYDGTILLDPGEYVYDAYCEGFLPESKIPFTVTVPEAFPADELPEQTVTVELWPLDEDSPADGDGELFQPRTAPPDPLIVLSVGAGAGRRTPTVFLQKDSRWADSPYGYPYDSGGSTIGESGCGILALTNAVYYLNGSFIDPPFAAGYAADKGFHTEGGTKWDFYRGFAQTYGKTFGIQYAGEVKSYSELKEMLCQDCVAICSVPGHFMALVDYDESFDRFLLLDSSPDDVRATGGGFVWISERELCAMPSLLYEYDGLYPRFVLLRAVGVLNVSGLLDGAESAGLDGYGTFDVWIDGEKAADDQETYSAVLKRGTSYRIDDIRAGAAYRCYGVQEGALEGSIRSGAPEKIVLGFGTRDYVSEDAAPPAGESAPPPLCVRWAGGLIGPGLRLPLPKT